MATVWSLDLLSGGEVELGQVFNYPEVTGLAANVFRYMFPVKLTAAGFIEDSEDTEDIHGFALEPALGVVSTPIDVLLANYDQMFVASQSNAGATQVTAQSMVGLACGWILSAVVGHTTKLTIDTADEATPRFEIVALDPRDAVGAADGRVIVRLVDAAISAR